MCPTDFVLSSRPAVTVVTWCDTVAVISQYHWITIVLHRQFVFEEFQIKLEKKKDKRSAALLQQIDDRNISQYELKIRDRLRSL